MSLTKQIQTLILNVANPGFNYQATNFSSWSPELVKFAYVYLHSKYLQPIKRTNKLFSAVLTLKLTIIKGMSKG